jgi:hypothetical protein
VVRSEQSLTETLGTGGRRTVPIDKHRAPPDVQMDVAFPVSCRLYLSGLWGLLANSCGGIAPYVLTLRREDIL